MALLQVDFRSQTLKRTVDFQVILPMEKFRGPYPTLYLLHGLTENSNAWLHNTRIRRWAEQSGLAVVMPSGENSFYLDIPVENGCLGDFGAYVGEELVAITREIFPLSHKREETYIAGFSMGGYGACRNGLKYCSTFGKAAILSGAVHFFEYSRKWVKTRGNTIGELQNIGNLDIMEETDRNPRYLMRCIKEQNEIDGCNHFPDFYVACGLQDELIDANRSIAMALKEAGANVIYEESDGIHDWYFGDECIQRVLKWLNFPSNDIRTL